MTILTKYHQQWIICTFLYMGPPDKETDAECTRTAKSMGYRFRSNGYHVGRDSRNIAFEAILR